MQRLDSKGHFNNPTTGANTGNEEKNLLRPVLDGVEGLRNADVCSERNQEVGWEEYPLLAGINGPGDLKGLTVAQLKQLAAEIRRFILETVSKTGGHLASNLGVVEITLALHYVFDFSQDKLVWDVGHQCYAHKIVTGRKEAFRHLRRAGGVSGFPNPEESQYDRFAVGHAGTSIGTAIGMAIGATRQGSVEKSATSDKIVAVIGDASIVNGASFEALNNLGLVKRQMLIVLNDNSMAIDATQGAVAKYFSRIRLSQTYDDLRRTTNDILEHVPAIGKTVEEAIARIKKSIRMAFPASQLFESLNIPYFGPVDGHEIGSLIELFGKLKQTDHPVILHCHTKKGMGFSPADSEPSKYHSTGPFEVNGDSTDASEAESQSKRRSFTDVFGEELAKLAEKDKRIVAITSAMCDGTGLMEFRRRFPDRFYDVGIAESAAVEIAAGMASSGLRPIVCIYSTFLQRSVDQVFQEVSLQNLPVVFCVDRAGLVGADGPTHHGLMDIGFLRMMPNLAIAAPADEVEMRGVLEFAIGADRPVCIRYPKDYVSARSITEASAEPFVLGKSVAVRSNVGSRVVVVSYGSVLSEVVAAAKQLAEEGVEVDVINARFAAPVDRKIVELLESGRRVVTVEDHGVACGFGSAVLEAAGQHGIGYGGGVVRVLGVPRRFIRHDSRGCQLMEAGINAERIAEAVKQILSGQQG
ncbi:MAG: 1-deoxy-D-xylulose-5-phosphate synthase [Sedimentisphaerales bacterium]|jgi:1-deoxy-D-xylulose-5-phosphate synthase